MTPRGFSMFGLERLVDPWLRVTLLVAGALLVTLCLGRTGRSA